MKITLIDESPKFVYEDPNVVLNGYSNIDNTRFKTEFIERLFAKIRKELVGHIVEVDFTSKYNMFNCLLNLHKSTSSLIPKENKLFIFDMFKKKPLFKVVTTKFIINNTAYCHQFKLHAEPVFFDSQKPSDGKYRWICEVPYRIIA